MIDRPPPSHPRLLRTTPGSVDPPLTSSEPVAHNPDLLRPRHLALTEDPLCLGQREKKGGEEKATPTKSRQNREMWLVTDCLDHPLFAVPPAAINPSRGPRPQNRGSRCGFAAADCPPRKRPENAAKLTPRLAASSLPGGFQNRRPRALFLSGQSCGSDCRISPWDNRHAVAATREGSARQAGRLRPNSSRPFPLGCCPICRSPFQFP